LNNPIKIALILFAGYAWATVLGMFVGEEVVGGVFLFQAIYCRLKYFGYRTIKIDPNDIPVLIPEVVTTTN